jgi:biopolymer transport protein ExbD/biopolymer transport protein TolR
LERLRALRTVAHEPEDRAAGEVKADINVTPLVDVVLVLLIIFMVVTPMIASGVTVDLPVTVHHSRKPDDGKDIIVSITSKEQVYVGSRQLSRVEDLGRAISEEQRRFPHKSVFVKGDARASFGLMRRAMEALRTAQITNVVLGTEERQDKQ